MTKYLTLVELLKHNAANRPQQIAYKFIKDGEVETGSLSYEQLEQHSKAIAAQLQTLVPADSRAILVYPYDSGLEFITAFFGCLCAKVVAVPLSPPRHGRAIAALEARVSSSQAKIILSTSELLSKLEAEAIAKPELSTKIKSLTKIATDKVSLDLSQNWQQPEINGDSLAFLQYTSGSTGIPKGVMVTHGNIVHNERIIERAFAHSDRTVVVGWLPMFHDMGLIGNVLQPFYLGQTSILMSPVSLARKPFDWLKAISHYRATTSGGPNFAYDLLCLKATPEQLANLDLSSWQVAFSGAETVRAETIERFSQIFASCGFRREAFYPCYGMAESTLFVTGGEADKPPAIAYVDNDALTNNQAIAVTPQHPKAKAIVSCGKTWFGDRVIIVDPETLIECGCDRVGEIWISGLGISQGYWQQPEATQNTFQGYLADTGEGPFLRSGDLGFWQNGELYITGRLKEVMIFWGRFRYPQHIEQTVEQCHPALRPNCSAAFSVDLDSAERLIIVSEIERSYLRNLNAAEIFTTIQQAVVENHEVEAYAIVLLKPGQILKTSSGKIQRSGCRQQFLAGNFQAIAEWHQSSGYQSDVAETVSLS